MGEGAAHAVPAEELYRRCVGNGNGEVDGHGHAHVRAVRVVGATVSGPLDLTHAHLSAPLHLESCTFEDEVRLDSVTAPAIHLVDCRLAAPLQLGRAKVTDDLDLHGTRLDGANPDGESLRGEGLEVGGSVRLDQGFRTAGALNLNGAHIGGDLQLAGAHLDGADRSGRSLMAVALHIGRSAFLDEGFHAAGAVMFANLDVQNILSISDARIDGTDSWGDSLNCIRAQIGGTVYARHGFESAGAVRFSQASVDGRFLLRDAQLRGADQKETTLAAGGLRVAGQLSLTGTEAAGAIVLERADIGGRLDLDGAHLTGANADGFSVEAAGVHVVGPSSFEDGFETAGALRLWGAILDGGITFEAARIAGCDPDGVALRASALRVRGGVYFGAGFEAAGALRLRNTNLEGGLALAGARLTGIDYNGHSLDARSMRLVGDLNIDRGTELAGAIALRAATVEGRLRIENTHIGGADDDGNALHAAGLHVLNDVTLAHGLEADGAIRLRNAVIDGNLGLEGARIVGINERGASLLVNGVRVSGNAYIGHGLDVAGGVSLRTAVVEGRLDLREVRLGSWLNLGGARCGELIDDESSWPAAGDLVLRGFRFGVLAGDAGWRRETEWARRQGFVDWSPDPYEQLAGYYVSVGDEDGARRVRMAKGWDELAHLKTVKPAGSWRYRLWRRPFGWFAGFGYRRWPAAALLVLTVLTAGLVFRLAEHDGAMVPSDPDHATAAAPPAGQPCGKAYPCFNSWVYGADVVLPIIDFGQDGAWRPVGSRWWVWSRWAFIAAGWVLASVFVAAFTGLVQRD
jgi:hypothetical protein